MEADVQSGPESLEAAARRRYRSQDPLFTAPYLDIDEWRAEPEHHRYVHGGFRNTELRFSCYFPEPLRYGGRFLQPVLPISGTEHALALGMLDGMGASLPFAFATGAFVVESNLGCPTPFPGDDPSIPGYRASAATATFARALAAELYGEHRAYGYVFGGSGGAFKTIACVENAPGVWDGAVPFVQGCPISIPNVFAAQAHAMRVLGDRIDQIVDAVEPGGSGDPYAGLNAEERDALAEVTRFGFPLGAWFDMRRIRSGYTALWGAFAPMIRRLDPGYFSDFWTEPGYLGADAPASLAAARINDTFEVAAAVPAAEAAALGLPVSMAQRVRGTADDTATALRLTGLPAVDLFGAVLTIDSGAAAGRVLAVSAVAGDVVAVGTGLGNDDGLAGVQPGDRVHLDNSDYLAFQTLHRHQVAEGFDCFEQFTAAGCPIYPQRPRQLGPAMAKGGWGHSQSGRFAVKMIAVSCLLDEAAYPWQAAWYQRRVQQAQGAAAADHHRLWYLEHAMHGTPSPAVVPGDSAKPSRLTRTIDYRGVLEQAIRDVIAWAELAIAPAADTRFELVDAQVRVSAPASARGGIQPTVHVRANGRSGAEVAVGEPVHLVAEAEVPPGAGTIVAAEWDVLGEGTFPLHDEVVDGALERIELRRSVAFDEPGTYFPAVRITSHRHSDPGSAFARVQNLGRVRVVVR